MEGFSWAAATGQATNVDKRDAGNLHTHGENVQSPHLEWEAGALAALPPCC